MNINKELIKKYATMFQVSLITVGVSLLIGIILLVNIVPQVSTLFTNRAKFKETKSQLANKQTELQTAKEEKERKDNPEREINELRAFYRNIKSNGNSSSEILSDEIKEIHDLITYYGIKVYKENNEYDIETDPFYASDKNKYSVCRMNLELFSTYMKFQSFLSDVFKHPHFLNIESIEINPYKKDKTILDVKMQLVIYAEKDVKASSPAVEAPEGEEIPQAAGMDSQNSEDLDIDIDLGE